MTSQNELADADRVLKRTPTMKDVSERAKVSMFTVSKALSGGEGIADATRERVLSAAHELGYIPNQLARGLRGGTTKTIGVLTANTNNLYYATLVNALEQRFTERGYHCIVSDAVLDGQYRVDREDVIIRDLLQYQVAAIVLTYRPTARNMAMLVERGVELVFVDTLPSERHARFGSVTSDNYRGAFALGEHFAEHQYRGPWAFLGFPESYAARDARERGFRDAAEESGVSVDVIEGKNDPESAYRATVRYIDEHQAAGVGLPRAFFAANELLLHGALRAFRDRGIRVPYDIAVVGYDDFLWAPLVDPSVTVIDQHVDRLGHQAASMLLRELDLGGRATGSEAVGPRIVVESDLVVRRSCGCSN